MFSRASEGLNLQRLYLEIKQTGDLGEKFLPNQLS